MLVGTETKPFLLCRKIVYFSMHQTYRNRTKHIAVNNAENWATKASRLYKSRRLNAEFKPFELVRSLP